MFSCIAQSRIAEPSAPLCDMNAMLPGFGILPMNVAFKQMLGRITPKQLGPIMRMPYFFVIS